MGEVLRFQLHPSLRRAAMKRSLKEFAGFGGGGIEESVTYMARSWGFYPQVEREHTKLFLFVVCTPRIKELYEYGVVPVYS